MTVIKVIDTNKDLKVLNADKLSKLRHVSIKYSDPNVSSQVILSRIKKQNLDLNLISWNLIEETLHSDGDRVIILQIDQNSFDII